MKVLPAFFQESSFDFHRDFFQSLQAVAGEAGANHIHASGALAAKFAQRSFGVGLQPFCFAKARLKRHLVLFGLQAQFGGQQARGFVALAVVHVAQLQGALRHAMKAHHQHIALAVRSPVLAHLGGQCADVARIVVVVVDEAQFGHAALAQRPTVHTVKHAGGGGAGVLRVGGQHQDAGHTLGLHGRELTVNGRVAISHGVAHHHLLAMVGEQGLQGLGLAFGPDLQGRALGQPDAGVFFSRLGWAHPQNDAVQNHQPQPARNLHHPRVAEKLRQVAAQGGGGGRVGRAQVTKQHPSAGSLAVFERRFGGKTGR